MELLHTSGAMTRQEKVIAIESLVILAGMWTR